MPWHELSCHAHILLQKGRAQRDQLPPRESLRQAGDGMIEGHEPDNHVEEAGHCFSDQIKLCTRTLEEKVTVMTM